MTELTATLTQLADIAKEITCVLALLAMFVKPVRERLFGEKAIKEGQKCLLRAEILRIYYRHQEGQRLRQYEYENLVYCYNAYKALGGNSFVEHIYKEMQSWDVHA